MTNQTFRIDIYSDVVCPWCYIGKRRLERALGQMKGVVQVQVHWRPFQLNPTMPTEGIDRTTYLEAKFGGREAFRQLEEQVLAVGASERIHFAFDKMRRTPNTFAAHRLIWYAQREQGQGAIVESLFRGYFEEGADIGSLPVLVDLAARSGLTAEAVERLLRGDEGTEEVKAEEAAGRRLGIRGVPYFVLDETYGISGAQPADTLMSVIETVRSGKAVIAQESIRR